MQEDKLQNQLSCQGSFLSSILKFSLAKINIIWPTCQSKLPKNIFNFSIIPCRTVKTCTSGEFLRLLNVRFASNPKLYYMSSLAVVPIWIGLLGDTTLFLILLPNNLQSDHIQKIFADLPSFFNPSIITGDIYRPDLLILTKDNTLYVVELTVGYETNLRNNINRKHSKYKDLIQDQKKKISSVTFINLSISALGVFD